MEKGNGNPLRAAWNFLGTIGGIISLSSLAEDWVVKGGKWRGFIADLVEAYRSLVNPVFETLFDWLPWNWSIAVGDYLVVGVLLSSSYAKAFVSIGRPSPERDMSLFESLSISVIAVLIFTWTWPLLAISAVLYPILWWQRASSSGDAPSYVESFIRLMALWFGAVVLGLVVLLAINTRLGAT